LIKHRLFVGKHIVEYDYARLFVEKQQARYSEFRETLKIKTPAQSPRYIFTARRKHPRNRVVKRIYIWQLWCDGGVIGFYGRRYTLMGSFDFLTEFLTSAMRRLASALIAGSNGADR